MPSSFQFQTPGKMFQAKETSHEPLQSKYNDETIANKLMYIPNDETQNYPLCRLQLVVDT